MWAVRFSRQRIKLSFESVELFGQFKILFRQSALIVRRECECNLVPTNIDVRVVPRLLSQFCHSVHEFDGGRKILELIHAGDGFALFLPRRHGTERGFDLSRSEFWHDE